jgi:hypothetical protein
LCVVCSDSNNSPHGATKKCHASSRQFSGLIDMWYSVLCPTQDDGWHDPTCIFGRCRDCRIDQLLTCPIEEQEGSTLTMQWKCYKKIMYGKTRSGKDK